MWMFLLQMLGAWTKSDTLWNAKNWGSSIPQTVVHSFTTVMHETGANIDLLFQSTGFSRVQTVTQKHQYIIGMTYLEFQKGILRLGGIDTFCPRIGDAADEPLQYVEPINSKRDREYAKLSLQAQEKFDQLRQEKGVYHNGSLYAQLQVYVESIKHW